MGMEAIKEKELARFYLELMDAEDEVDQGQAPPLSGTDGERWRQGLPAMALARPEVNEESVFDRLMSAALACLKWQPGPRLLPEHIPDALKGLPALEQRELGKAVFYGYSPGQMELWAARLGVDSGMLSFLSRHAARPFLRSFARSMAGQLNYDHWGKGHCPVCGDFPGMSRLTGEEGARKLYCTRCETEWRYMRIGCPFCGNQDSSSLSYIEIEGCGQYRLYLCDKCKCYLKTVDGRKVGETDLFCADLATSGLDRLAAGEGYRRGASSVDECV